jgi:hypothetical protein
MKIGELNGYEFHVPTSGGKAGKGHQKTSTIQVRAGSVIVKQFRFVVADQGSRDRAIRKAKDYVLEYGI